MWKYPYVFVRITCKERCQGERLLSKKVFRKRIKVLLLQVCREDSCCPWDSSSGLHPGQHASSPPSPTRATVKIIPRFPLHSFLMLARMNGWIDGRICSSACLDNLTFKGCDFTGHRSSLCHCPCYFQLHSIVIKDFKAPWKLCFAQVGFCSVKSLYFLSLVVLYIQEKVILVVLPYFILHIGTRVTFENICVIWQYLFFCVSVPSHWWAFSHFFLTLYRLR